MQNNMIVKLVVTVEALEVAPNFRTTEELVENEAVEMVARAVRQFGAVKLLSVEILGPKHCDFMREIGIPFDIGLPLSASVTSEGSWSYPHGMVHTDPSFQEGHGLLSLVQFVIDAKGGVK